MGRKRKEITEFYITDRHISLVKKLKIIWNKEGVGAPMVDSEEPYGEGKFFENVAEGLGIGLMKDRDGRTLLQEGQGTYFDECHRDMEMTLQICLSRGKFTAGYFVKENGEWIRKSKHPPVRRKRNG